MRLHVIYMGDVVIAVHRLSKRGFFGGLFQISYRNIVVYIFHVAKCYFHHAEQIQTFHDNFSWE